MTGKGAAGGFDFQARISAFVAVHVIAKRQLRWTRLNDGDVPAAVQAESGGAGDDVRIELAGSQIVYECQAKRGLKAGKRLDEAVDLLAGLLHRPDERGILVVDPTSARPRPAPAQGRTRDQTTRTVTPSAGTL